MRWWASVRLNVGPCTNTHRLDSRTSTRHPQLCLSNCTELTTYLHSTWPARFVAMIGRERPKADPYSKNSRTVSDRCSAINSMPAYLLDPAR